jgi:hypothetical protein
MYDSKTTKNGILFKGLSPQIIAEPSENSIEDEDPMVYLRKNVLVVKSNKSKK